MKSYVSAAIFSLLALPVMAQEAPNTILVLDASGSMWGQIDGKAKITIAQEVVGSLLDSLPADQNLGLTVYGHRTKGDCTDIETVVSPGPGTRDAIRAAVMGIKPKGKTPMTDAVIAAAEALKYTEDAATVILVSDGIETCNPDPCAAAKLLEEAGVNFTAHVVGFDVAGDPQAQAQLQCLAENTGGQYRGASNAAELATALTEVVAAEPVPPAEPLPGRLRVTVREGSKTGPEILDGIKIFLTAPEGETDEDPATIADAGKELAPGNYRVSALRIVDEASVEAAVELTDGESEEVVLVLPEYRPGATLAAPDQADAGSTVKVDWKGPEGETDYLSIANADMEAHQYINYAYIRKGNPVDLEMPTDPGTYDIRYIWKEGKSGTHTVLATRQINVVAVQGGLGAPDEAVAGTEIKVDWQGGGYQTDYISIAEPESEGNQYLTYTYVREGNPVTINLPTEAGTYEIRYINGQDHSILITRPIKVTEASATISGPAEAKAAQEIKLDWTGPAVQNDYISVAKADADPETYETYTYVREGSPLKIVMPSAPGDYELRYIAKGNKAKVLVAVPIKVSAHEGVTMTFPATAPKDGEIKIDHTGPGYDRDYIGIVKIGADQYSTYQYVRGETTVKVKTPEEPGDYEVVYFLGGDAVPVARVPLKIE